jgi:hypothetical protein
MDALLDALKETDVRMETLPKFYRLSLAYTVEFELYFGLLTAEEAWDHHVDLNQENDNYPTALAAGVWYVLLYWLVGHDDVSGIAATVRETVEPHLDRLSPTAQTLYTLWFTDETAATPLELRERLNTDDYLTALEIAAYERLLSAFGS